MSEDLDNKEALSPEDLKKEEEGSNLSPSQEQSHLDNNSLSGMYKSWYLDYAAYVILSRAVPHIDDGLKPVQRRILHTLFLAENGNAHKVAKIVGQTMAFHPHGDASINSALVQLGQKDYLVEKMGNWGNILTGDGAAAGRYIETKLSPLALDVLFDPKLTEWKKNYDGTTNEPITLPARFPILLAQGAEGIAVGLVSKILPHNPKELLEAAIAYLKGDTFEIYPDFPTGGLLDVEKYNDGKKGASLKIRAKIEKIDDRVLSITELPFGKTTSSLIESIRKAHEKGKIKIKHIDDFTAETADIRIELPTGVSTDKTIDGLYAFTDCEGSISPTTCVIKDGKPVFLGVSDLLKHSADRTCFLLTEQLRYRHKELSNMLLAASLERIFIEQRIYKDKEFEEAKNESQALEHIRQRVEALENINFIRPITNEDLKQLLEIRMARILRFNIKKHEEKVARYEDEYLQIEKDLKMPKQYTIQYYKRLLKEYGSEWERKTTLTRFGTIEATKVIEINEKLYIDREGGFIGTKLRNAEFVTDCSSIDDIIIIFKNGNYLITKVEEKKFIGKENILYINRFQKNDKRTIYNLIYRQGKKGAYFIKRCSITGLTRDKVYELTDGTEGSKLVYLTVNFNGEAETVRISLKPVARMRTLVFERDFKDVAIRGKFTKGNLVTKAEIQRITLKEKGISTLGGRKVWFDRDVLRLNYNGQGDYIGEFESEDRILVVQKDGFIYTTDFSESNHFSSELDRIEKWDGTKEWTAVYKDVGQGFYYLKRFSVEEFTKSSPIQGENGELLLYTDNNTPRIEIEFGGKDKGRPAEIVEAFDFVAVKSLRAKGKRLTTRSVASVKELENLIDDELEESNII